MIDTWAETLAGVFSEVKQQLGRGVADRRHPARHPTFASISPDGLPQARTLVLRAFDPEQMALAFHTDGGSDKMAGLRERPFAAIHIWHPSRHLQIRMTADVTIFDGPDAADAWAKVPEASRENYTISPKPGSPLDAALDYEKGSNQARFSILSARVSHMDILYLGDCHRRARYDRLTNWAGHWVAP